MLNYKNYIGFVEFDNEAEIFHGEVINTRDVITFQGETVQELKRSFMDSINDYLKFCASMNEEPDKPFSGKFNLRIDPELHREAYVAARKSGISLNSWVEDAIIHSLLSDGDSKHAE